MVESAAALEKAAEICDSFIDVVMFTTFPPELLSLPHAAARRLAATTLPSRKDSRFKCFSFVSEAEL
jgi:hypothetical protein